MLGDITLHHIVPFNTRFQVGDRVVRPKNVFKNNSPMMHGTISRVYATSTVLVYDTFDFPYRYNAVVDDIRWGDNEVYEVLWDERFRMFSYDGAEYGHLGFLPHGLDKEVGDGS